MGEWDQIVEEMDENKDGVVDWGEFRNVMQGDMGGMGGRHSIQTGVASPPVSQPHVSVSPPLATPDSLPSFLNDTIDSSTQMPLSTRMTHTNTTNAHMTQTTPVLPVPSHPTAPSIGKPRQPSPPHPPAKTRPPCPPPSPLPPSHTPSPIPPIHPSNATVPNTTIK